MAEALTTGTLTRLASLLAMFVACGAGAQTISDTELAQRFNVNGVRVSNDSQIAIINDRLIHVGDQISGAQVIAIESNLVHLRLDQQTFAMRVGSSIIRESDYADVAQNKPDRAAAAAAHADAPLATDATNVSGQREVSAADWYGPIAPGETLSEIAATLAPEYGQHTHLMSRLFESNPHAFGDSMDMLYAGARLKIPAQQRDRFARQQAPEHDAAQRRPGIAAEADPPIERRVAPGDTLSEIAAELKPPDITLNQWMLAIYAANPDSFGGNINLLFAGAVLQAPTNKGFRQISPAAARAEVARQASVWRASQPINST